MFIKKKVNKSAAALFFSFVDKREKVCYNYIINSRGKIMETKNLTPDEAYELIMDMVKTFMAHKRLYERMRANDCR